MSVNLFLTEVEFVVDTNTYTIPSASVNIVSGPYSREGGNSTSVRAFDGRYYQIHQGWRSRVTFNWQEMTEDSQQDLYDFIVDLQGEGVCTVNFTPGSTATSFTMVLEDASTALQAAFKGNARNRPASISFLSQNISATSGSWITANDDPSAYKIQYISSTGKWIRVSADLNTFLEPNPALDLSIFNSGLTAGIERDPFTGKNWGVRQGDVYNWNDDGSGFQQVFSTGHGDIKGIVLNPVSQHIALVPHEQSVFNHRFKLYEYDGTLFDDIEFRDGSSTLTNVTGSYGDGSYYFADANNIHVVYPSFSGNTIDNLGVIGHFQSQDCVYYNNTVYHLANTQIVYQSGHIKQTDTAPNNDTVLVGCGNGQSQIDYYQSGGIVYLITNNFRCTINGSGATSGWNDDNAAVNGGIEFIATIR